MLLAYWLNVYKATKLLLNQLKVGERKMRHFLERFIGARFWLLPIYVSIYYLQLYINANTKILTVFKGTILVILILFLIIAVLANRMWAAHFRERVFSGLKFMIDNKVTVSEQIVLEQHRWAGAQILGLVLIILGALWQLSDVGKFGENHIVPVLVTAMVIFVALFDAALDLSAVQVMCFLATTKKPEEESIGKLFYHTNQRNEIQKKLYREIIDENSEIYTAIKNDDASYLSYKTFSGQAQNLIAMAIIVVFYISAIAIFHLFKQLKVLF